ncbi:hypothetical protein WME89_06370 [Sorangium sp. So ce321]|uniref:hypothetical protein n=1 Tax=Sorangium sp. So ce321 TaxID=3133300 RepID=UPI003F601066
MSIVTSTKNGVRMGFGALAFIGSLLGSALDANAATFTINDNLESGGWASWASNPAEGAGFFASWALARSPSTIAYLSYSPSAGASDWLQFSKGFTTTVTPTSCSASVWLRGNGYSNHGSVEMLDTTGWTYIGSTPYSGVGTAAWVKYTVNNTYACTKNITVRVTLGANPGVWEQVYVDDASISWNY